MPAPAAAAAVPSERAAVPTPAPARVDEIAVCALDPSSARGLGVIQGVHVEGAADTLGVLDGRRVPLEEAARGGTLAQAAWFKAGQPFALQVGRSELRFDVYDTGRIIDPSDLAYLGEADGLPVFAAAEDLKAVRDAVEVALDRDKRLSAVIASSTQIRRTVAGLQVLYVPLQRTRCVFQALLRRNGP